MVVEVPSTRAVIAKLSLHFHSTTYPFESALLEVAEYIGPEPNAIDGLVVYLQSTGIFPVRQSIFSREARQYVASGRAPRSAPIPHPRCRRYGMRLRFRVVQMKVVRRNYPRRGSDFNC